MTTQPSGGTVTIEDVPVPLWINTHVYGPARINPAMRDLLGVHDLVLADWRSHVHPDDHEPLHAALTTALDGAQPYEVVFRVRASDGTYRWVIDRGRPQAASSGGTVVVGAISDVTDQLLAERALGRRGQVVDAMLTVAATLGSAGPYEVGDAIRTSLPVIGGALEVDRALIIEVDEHAGTMFMLGEWVAPGSPAADVGVDELPTADLPELTAALVRRESVLVDDLANLPEAWWREREAQARRGIRSYAAVPFSFATGTVGALIVESFEEARDWTRELSSLELVCRTFRAAFDRERMQVELDLAREAVDRRRASEQLLLRVSTRFVERGPAEVGTAIDDTITEIGRTFGVDRVLVALADPGEVGARVSHEWTAEGVAPCPPDLDELFVTGNACLVDLLTDASVVRLPGDPRVGEESTAVALTLVDADLAILVPIMVSADEVVGMLAVTQRDGVHRWDDDDIGLLQVCAELLGHAIRIHRADRLLDHQAGHDPLTDLLNRRRFLDEAARTLAGTGRRGAELVAMLFVDLDGFKQINDRCGHEAGDVVLVEVAQRLSSLVRPHDLVGRLGGDEFTILLRDLSTGLDAELVAERILAALQEPIGIGEAFVHVGASVGVAVAKRGTTAATDLLQQADTVMYAAKQAGKGRFVSATL